MKKILLLASLLLSSAAQAETWICSSISSEKQTMYKFVRSGEKFIETVTTGTEESSSMNEILAEDEDQLIIGYIRASGFLSGAIMKVINKKTLEFVIDGMYVSNDYAFIREEGICTKI